MTGRASSLKKRAPVFLRHSVLEQMEEQD